MKPEDRGLWLLRNKVPPGYLLVAENEIDAIPGVTESAVIGVPHADFGEAVFAVLAMESEPVDPRL